MKLIRLGSLVLMLFATGFIPAALAADAGLAPGKYGSALAAQVLSAQTLTAQEIYSKPPLTVECWALLNSAKEFNLLVANGPKTTDAHWEIYSCLNTGRFSAYLPGYEPAELKSEVVITDGRWHYLAMTFDGQQVKLGVDGKEVLTQKVVRKNPPPTEANLVVFGSALNTEFGCDGLIDEVRISNMLRPLDRLPEGPFTADEQTIGLWHFDAVDARNQCADASKLSNPAALPKHFSLDENDNASFNAGPVPLSTPAVTVPLQEGTATLPSAPPVLSLDGEWQMVEGGTADERLNAVWEHAIPATVPGSVHTALSQAKIIPFPFLGRNQDIAREWSNKTYWLKRTFPRPPSGSDQTLVFHGICNRCTVWLNGKELGKHEGMFTSLEYPAATLWQEANTVIVKLDPAIDWTKTVVFNNSYGWHYAKFPPLGIWRSVEIRGEPIIKPRDVFIATRDAKAGLMDVLTTVAGPAAGWSGKLLGVIVPDNFQGAPYHFEYPVKSSVASQTVHLQITVPNPRLWWPVDLGAPNLYKLQLAFLPAGGGVSGRTDTVFGIRTVQMAPVNGKPSPVRCNWTFVVNGQPMFVKGTGWCTCDAMMDFSRARYDRLLTLAASQHVQMLRAWGSGMVETDDFYDLCDRKGLMVMQEWPTAWNSHNSQPLDLLEQTVRENTLRLRSHPSLAIYTGGNESGQPFGPAIDMMGRLNLELDGTRAFHRGEPYGGSQHDYNVWWGGAPLDAAIAIQAVFFGEFGIASYPAYESVQRFLPPDEQTLWPPPPDRSFAYHTPIFNTAKDLERLQRLSQYFTAGATMERFIVGTQLAQAVGVRHALERARTRWPECTGALYYKMNDNSPAASWSTVDWYGGPKISHYLIQDSFAPVLAVALFSKTAVSGEPLALPVFLLDDAGALKDAAWEVVVRAYGADLKPLKESRFSSKDPVGKNAKLGEFTLTAEQTKTAPLLVVTDVLRDRALVKRNYYVANFASVKDCLFNLPRTKLTLQVGADHQVEVKNEGPWPAVGVAVAQPGHLDTFLADDNYFWLDAGESRKVTVNATTGLSVGAWNAE